MGPVQAKCVVDDSGCILRRAISFTAENAEGYEGKNESLEAANECQQLQILRAVSEWPASLATDFKRYVHRRGLRKAKSEPGIIRQTLPDATAESLVPQQNLRLLLCGLKAFAFHRALPAKT